VTRFLMYYLQCRRSWGCSCILWKKFVR